MCRPGGGVSCGDDSRSLPAEYDSLVTALAIRPKAVLAINTMKEKVIHEYQRKRFKICRSVDP